MKGNTKKRKQFLAYVLVFAVILTVLPMSVFATQVSDIQSHWAKAQIQDWMDKKLVTGYPDGSFKPDNNITRAEFMVLVNKAFGYEEKAPIQYTDVKEKDWFAEAVAKAKAAGYIEGYPDGTIRPNNFISREEAAAIIQKIEKLSIDEKATDQFTDKATFTWSKGAIGAVAKAGIMNGYADGSFKPQNPIKRAEALVALDRVLKGRPKVYAYNKPGIYGPTAGIAQVEGNVEITSSGVTLQNMVINGSLTIAESVGEGEVYLKGLTVKGDTIIQGGGLNSIHFDNTVVVKIIVNKADGNVRIVVSGSTVVQEVTLESGAKLEEKDIIGKGFEAINIEKSLPKDSKVTLLGTFETVELKATSILVEIEKGAIENLKVDSAATNTKVNVSIEAKVVSAVIDAIIEVIGKGTVTNANVNISGVIFEKPPGKIEIAPGVERPKIITPTPPISSGGQYPTPDPGPSTGDDSITVTSTAFENEAAIPFEYSRYGDNTPIPLQWEPIEGATNYALLMYDVSTEDPEYPEHTPFVHWAVTGITDLEDILSGATEYTNNFGEIGYGGPQPPNGEHIYKIRIYALGETVTLEDDEWGITKANFEEALENKVLAIGDLTGTFAVIEAIWEPGEVDIFTWDIYDEEDNIIGTDQFLGKEYTLKAGEETIDISDTNVKSIFVNGEHFLPTTDSTLLVPIEMGTMTATLAVLEEMPIRYHFVIVTNDNMVYGATLNWVEPTEAEVEFQGPMGAEAVFSNEFGIAYIDFSEVTVDKLHDWSSEEDPEYYAIELSIVGIDLSEANVKKAFRIYDDGTIIQPEISGDLNAQYVTTKWELGESTMYYVLQDDTIFRATINVISLTPKEYPTIEWVGAYDLDDNNILDSLLIRTNYLIDDSSVNPALFLIDGVPAVEFYTGESENDEYFWIDFNEAGHGTENIPTLTVLPGAFKDLDGDGNVEITNVLVEYEAEV